MEYVNGNIRLLHDDCMDYMRTLPDNAFDLAVVDPPYGSANSESSGGGGDSDLASRGTWNRLKGGRRERYYHHLPPHTQKGTQTQGASKEEHGQSDTDDAKPG